MKEEPPLCPIDRNVLDQCLKELDKKEDTEYITTIKNVQKSGGWGQLKDISEYKKLVEIIQKLSERKGMTPAVWELAFFNGVIDAEEDLEG